jgi:site-specific DNA-methyltransferase (adenine-specific)
MKPYYQDSHVTIYHGDCAEIIPSLGNNFDAVITDPPYNVGKDYGTHNDSMSDGDYEAYALKRVNLCRVAGTNQFWVAPRYKLELWLRLLPKSHLIVIPRGASGPLRGGWIDQFEIALASGKTYAKHSDLWKGIRLKGEGYFFTEETYGHPGYTPEPIMRLAVGLLSVQSILDPFCGTGTTLRAAKDLGRKCVGIEIEERYCEISATRMSQEVLHL